MAKPIEPTPVLKGQEARTFLDDIMHPEKITEVERKFLEEVKKMKSAIKV